MEMRAVVVERPGAATLRRVPTPEPGAGEVLVRVFRACCDCARCREGRTNLCAADYAETGFTHAGAFADFLCLPAHLVHQLPPRDGGLERAS
jgi:D-arabinose 1-dehydrogenase-like Zn-dependent alcohol dehydrogenase